MNTFKYLKQFKQTKKVYKILKNGKKKIIKIDKPKI